MHTMEYSTHSTTFVDPGLFARAGSERFCADFLSGLPQPDIQIRPQKPGSHQITFSLVTYVLLGEKIEEKEKNNRITCIKT